MAIRRFVSCTFAVGWIAPWAALAHAETDACTLVTTAQVGAAIGGSVKDGTHVTPTFVKTCTWLPAGASKILSVTLNLQNAAYHDGAKRQATMATAAAGKGSEIRAASVGDDAYYFVAGDQVALFVKKGGSSFKVAVYAKLPVEEKAAMELELAKEVVPRL